MIGMALDSTDSSTGAIEMAILSDYYEAEIAAVDIETTNVSSSSSSLSASSSSSSLPSECAVRYQHNVGKECDHIGIYLWSR
jgi:hypothetical protein